MTDEKSQPGGGFQAHGFNMARCFAASALLALIVAAGVIGYAYFDSASPIQVDDVFIHIFTIAMFGGAITAPVIVVATLLTWTHVVGTVPKLFASR
jgi:hypothetical protein